MPRASTKSDLLLCASAQFDKLAKLIDSMPKEEQSAAFHFVEQPSRKEAHWTRDKNLRDVLIHLYEWHHLLLEWVKANTAGEEKSFLPKPYNWKTYGQMNMELWAKHQATSLEDSIAMLLHSHQGVMDMMEKFSNEELFERKHFAWTGTSTLGSYCVSTTSSHYDWAIKKIKLHRKTYQETH